MLPLSPWSHFYLSDMLSANSLPYVWASISLFLEATKRFGPEAAEFTSMRNTESRLKKEKITSGTQYGEIVFPDLSENSLKLVRSLKIRPTGSSANCPWSFSNSNPYLCSNKQNKHQTAKWSFSPLARRLSSAQQVLLPLPLVPLRGSGQCQRWPRRWFTKVWGL